MIMMIRRCGLVALQMAVDVFRSIGSSVDLLDHPIDHMVDRGRRMGVTSEGEMYSARGMAELAGDLWPELRFTVSSLVESEHGDGGGSCGAGFRRMRDHFRSGWPCLVP